MKDYTNFLIDLLTSCNPCVDVISILELIVSNVSTLDSHRIHLVLSLLPSNDGFRYEAFKILDERINALTVDDLICILQCFEKDEYKYEIIIKLIKKCLPALEYQGVLLQIENETLRIDVLNIIDTFGTIGNSSALASILESLKNFDSKERLDLLEQSIAGTGVKLEDSENYCEHVKELLGDDFENGCQILGINPDIYVEFM